ncbi:sodium:proton antiporter [Reichenbachiella sp. 5M10]|uniref:cation:proton antiporter n=1 Tax=Reichenbachiella sp. 5M10 TaxID=1889772 RepID=UPI000C14D041|nr:sodium:proton antiporter [Reichenbachiella sp. 5M10]PIB36123.1 sodium:proton antiporter [Reichenbachiella sp. 5M10]
MQILDILALFIFLAGVFIYINTYYLKLPSSVGLMILALGLSIALLILNELIPEFKLGTERILKDYDYHEVLYQLVLSFMLFAGALQIDFKKLAEERAPVLILALLGVLISTAIVGTGVHYLLDWIGLELDLMYCLVFGALISPTDPIAITSTIRKYNLSKNLETRMAGESLFNDGIAVVLALTLLDLAHSGEDHYIGPIDILWVFGTDIIGGIIIGLFLGYLGYRLLKYIDNDEVEVEVLMTLALVMAGTQLAEFTHVSAKQAVVIMGLVIGNEGKSGHVTSAAGDYVFKFWYLIEETLNAMLFVLIGLEMLIIPLRFDYFAAGLFAFIIVLFARYVSVGVPIAAMSPFRKFEKNTINVLAWGGLRGGIPIALSLSLPDFEGKDIIITMTYTVVVCSVLYQGLTVPYLMRTTFTEKKLNKS